MDPVLKAGIDLIRNDFVKYVTEYLITGKFNQPGNRKFIEAYSYFLRLTLIEK